MYKKTTKGWSKHLDFILMDMLCFYLSFFIANFIRHRTRNLFINEFYINFAIILAALHLIFVFGYISHEKENFLTIFFAMLQISICITQLWI